MTRLEFDYTLTLDEVGEGLAPTFRRQAVLLRLIGGLGIAALVAGSVWSLRIGGTWLDVAPWSGVAAGCSVALWRSRNFARTAYRKIYQQSSTLQAPMHAVINDSGVALESYYVSSTSRWERFTHWIETKNLIVLYEGRIALILPKRALADPAGVDALRDACREYIRHQTYRPPVRAFAPLPPAAS